MRRSRDDTAQSRKKIVAEAARLVRQNGLERLGVGEVMQAAGMTHGGFYRHFASKEALVTEALEAAFNDVPIKLDPETGAPVEAALTHYVEEYLSFGHVATPSAGCPVAALGAEVSRATDDVRAAFMRRTERLIDTVARGMGPDEASRADAIRLLSTLIGSVVLARSVTTEVAQAEILTAARDGVKALLEETAAPSKRPN